MSEGPVVIVGGGAAAQAAAASFREAGGRAPIKILAAEPLLPYERPPLSKDYLRGETPRGELLIEPEGWYRENEIQVMRGAPVEQINLERMVAYTDDGVGHRFGQCLLATGARPLVPEFLGSDLRFVHTIRKASDSERLARAAGCRVLVVGSGFIGCEAAASLAMRNASVTIATLEAGPQLERLGEQVSRCLTGWLEGLGVEFLAEAELAEISERDDPGGIVEFKDGRRVEADVVLLAVGISRNDERASRSRTEFRPMPRCGQCIPLFWPPGMWHWPRTPQPAVLFESNTGERH
jgi:NAD(P)H-nitrite reductase large subunit